MPTTTTQSVVSVSLITCCECGKTRKASPTANGLLRVTGGWKRDGKTAGSPVYCPACWADRASLRALTLPIAGVVSCDDAPATWAQFREALRAEWAQTTALCNWALTQFYCRDVRREPGVEKMPAMPRVYLYPEARERFPGLPPTALASILQAVEKKYRATRYDLIWTASVALPTYKYPTPCVAHCDTWSLDRDGAGRPVVSVRLGAHRWKLALRRGPRYARQLAGLTRIVKQGELAIYRKRAGESKGGDGGSVTDREGGQRVTYDVMCKLVVHLRRDRPGGEPQPRTGTLKVHTAADALLVAINAEDERIWTWHAAQIPRWVAEHRKRLDQWSDDSKAEQRPVPDFAARRDAMVAKQRRRLDAAVKEAARNLANYAKRRGVLRVELDNSVRTFCASFPWYALRDRLAVVLDEYRIEFASTGHADDAADADDASGATVLGSP